MSIVSSVTGEVSDSKVAAIFDSESTARRVAGDLRAKLDLADSQVQVITPHDPLRDRKLMPENRGILRTIVIAHYRLGLAGLAVGAIVFALLYAAGLPFIVASPLFAAAVITSFGGLAGLLLGGLVSLRPDQDPCILKVRGALKQGSSAVVVHAFDADELHQARDALSDRGGDTIRTL